MSNALNLTRALALNDAGGTQLFTFLLSMNDLETFFERPTRSSPIYYEGHEWYLTCGGYQSKETEDIFLGMYLYWDNKAAGEGVSCRADYRLIVRNVGDAAESVVSEGSQVEFSAPDTLGWGKRELVPLHEVLGPGNGFLVDPGRTVIIELAVRYCRTIYQQMVDFSQLPEHMNQPYTSYFTPNFSLSGFDFYLSFYPLGDREEAERHVSMYLHRHNNPQIPECLCCRIRYRFFLGDRVSPTGDSKTFEFSFKTDRGYGRFKAFEPLAISDIFKKGVVPLGVEILSIVPFAFVEVPLATRGYYHTDNFLFDDVIFPDHRMNVWRLAANNSSQYLSFRLDVEDRSKIYPVSRQAQGRDALCTKYLQWKAYLLSRTDRLHNVSISDSPMSSYFSPAFPEKLFGMATNIPIQKAKSLDGDYCTNEEPSLLLRVEFFNMQDIPGVMQDYPVLEFERFRLYQTREGLRRCLDVNSSLRSQLTDLRQRLNEVMNISESSGSTNSKQQLMREFRSLLQASDETDSSNQAAYKSMMVTTPASDHFATAFSFSGSASLDTPSVGMVSPHLHTEAGASKEHPNRISQLFSSHPGTVLPDFGSAPPTTTAVAMPSASKSKLSSLGAALRNSKGGAPSFLRGSNLRGSSVSTSSVKFSSKAPPSPKPNRGSSVSQSILKDGPGKQSGPAHKTSSLDRMQVAGRHFNPSVGSVPSSQMRGNTVESARVPPDQTVYASISVPSSKTAPTATSPASNAFAIVSKPPTSYDSDPAQEYDSSAESRKMKFNPNIFKSVLPKRSSSGDNQAAGGKSSTLPRSSHPAERGTDFFGNRSLQRPGPGIFNQSSSRSSSSLNPSLSMNPAVQKVVPTQSPSSTLTRSGAVTSLNNPDSFSNPPSTITTAIVMPVQDVTYLYPESERMRKPPIPAPRRGLVKKPLDDDDKAESHYPDDKRDFDFEAKVMSQYTEMPTKPSSHSPPTLEQEPSEEKGAFSRASVASIDDPMLQSDVYSIFAQAARDGIKLVEEAPEMDEPLAMAAPEKAPKAPAPQPQPTEPARTPSSRAVPEITISDPPHSGQMSAVPRNSRGPQPLSPSILKKGDSFSSDVAVNVKKSRSTNSVRFNEDNISVTSSSSSSETPGQGQTVTSQADNYKPTESYDPYGDQSYDQYDGHKVRYSSEGQTQSNARQSSQQQQYLQQQQRQQQQRKLQQQQQRQLQQQQQRQLQQEQQLRQQYHQQQLQRQQQQLQQQNPQQPNTQQHFQQQNLQQLPQKQQQQQQQQRQYTHQNEPQDPPNIQQMDSHDKQQYRLEQLRREHQAYVDQLLQKQQQQRQQHGAAVEQQEYRRQSAPRSDSNLSRSKSESSGVVQTSL